MDNQNWWKSFTHELRNTFILAGEANAARTRLNNRAIGSFIFRLGLYGLGTFLVYSSLTNLLSLWYLIPWWHPNPAWYLDPSVINGAGILSLILAGVGLFFFFRLGNYRLGLQAKTYFWWLLGTLVALSLLYSVVTANLPTSTYAGLILCLGSVLGVLYGIDMMIIAYIKPRKAPARHSSASQTEKTEETPAYQVTKPQHRISELILEPDLFNELQRVVDVVPPSKDTSGAWRLSAETQVSYVALHLYGKPGTGKTLAAHALADYLKQNILAVTYADFEATTQYYSEINKKIREAFFAADSSNALLFIDEADPLFTQGISPLISSQVRTSLEQFHGVVIFVTNAIETYNKAFETRIRHIHFPMPDEQRRLQLWQAYLPATFPRADEVNPATLAKLFEDLNGREIKQSISEALQIARVAHKSLLELSDLEKVVARLKKGRLPEDSDTTIDSRKKRQYWTQDPMFTYDQLQLSKSVEKELLLALEIIRNEAKIFDEWGLRAIEKAPSTALNFYGPPGTGKTLAAHALANLLKRPIIVANYGDIVGYFVGEPAINTNTLFRTAERENAVLFIDEADALLAKRLTTITQSADMSLNSLSNQMLIAIENFRGVVIFATNMIQSYDKAFDTRVRHIHFPLPDEECRQRIWRVHLPAKLPKAQDVDVVKLAVQSADMCGRDIKNAVVEAAAQVNMEGRQEVTLSDLVAAITRIKNARVPQQGGQEERRQRIMDLLQHELTSERSGQDPSAQQTTRPLGQVGQNGGGQRPEVPETRVLENMASGQNDGEERPEVPETRVPQQNGASAEVKQTKPTQPLPQPLSEQSGLDAPTQRLTRLRRPPFRAV